MRVHLDFETHSELDVKKVGAWTYSAHPSTDIISIAFAIDDCDIIHLTQDDLHNEECSDVFDLTRLAKEPHVVFVAHNAFFEQCIWRNIMVKCYDFPEIPIERWRCTAAKAAYCGLPRDLKGVGSALDLPVQKSDSKAILKLCRPRKQTKTNDELFWTPETAPEDFEEMYKYNIIDVETERLVDKAIPELNANEQSLWFLDQKINFHGVKVDVPAVHKILDYIELTTAELKTRFRAIMKGELDSPSQVAAFLKWLAANGLELSNLQAATVTKALKADGLTNDVREALEIRQALSKISTAKYNGMLTRIDPSDMYLRDTLLYCAAITHRWGGRGVQLQNLPRGTVDSDTVLEVVRTLDYDDFTLLYDKPMAAYSSAIRGVLIPDDGCDFIVSDLDSIEARVLPWLAGQENVLDIFRNNGDIYCTQAESIFGRKIIKERDKYERSVGKVAVLALGYGGGIGAFGTMARGYGISLLPAYESLWPSVTAAEEDKARSAYRMYLSRTNEEDPLSEKEGLVADVIKQRWRIANPYIVQYWKALEIAAIQAVLTGEKQYVGGKRYLKNWQLWTGEPPGTHTITYGTVRGSRGNTSLLCRLASGNCISYPSPKVSMKETIWGEEKLTLSYMTVDTEKNYQFDRTYTYGGKLCENIVQSVSRDLLAGGLKRIDAAGFNINFHTHDEAVSSVPKGTRTVEEHDALLAAGEPWSTGLPISAHGWRGSRYRK